MTPPVACFPGQGVPAQAYAAAADRAPEVIAEASDVLGVDMAELCREGRSGEADLTSTRWAQPALVACAVASLAALEAREGPCDTVTGHSLGEYPALVAAGSLDLADALQLVDVRARSMDEAARATPGTMTAVLGCDPDRLTEICEQTGVVVAADNAPGQQVVSGPSVAIDAATAALNQMDVRTIRLEVAGAFHSPAMRGAEPHLRAAVDAIPFRAPARTIWSPTLAAPMATPEAVGDVLVAQLTSPVRWRQTVEAIWQAGARAFLDAGPGRVVTGLIRRIVPGAEVLAGSDLLAEGAR